MVVLLGATFGAEVLPEFAFALGRTARGVFSRPLAATTIAVVMVVDLVFAFSARNELVVVVVFVCANLGVLAALVVRMLGFRAMHVAWFLCVEILGEQIECLVEEFSPASDVL